MRREHSTRWLERATKVIPGGVNSPVRAFKSVGGHPLFMARGAGPYLYDVDGNRFLDYVMSYGPLILGHAPKVVTEAIHRAAKDGTSFGMTTALEVELAEHVCAAVPSLDKVRFVNSGTEATMSAVRLARGITGRDRIVKFAGCYHGHGDSFLSEAGSGLATLGMPGSPGVPEGTAKDTVTLPYNDLSAVEAALADIGDTVAAIIVEPIACNLGMMQPVDGFLQGLRRVCDQHGCLLIFDEVITGFRVGLAGAQGLFDVCPDLSTYGKIIGGGLPVGAYGGKAEHMAHIAPEGPVYQAGTLSGNPLAMAAGLATIRQLEEPGFYETLAARTEKLQTGINEVFTKHDNVARCERVGSIWSMWFRAGQDGPPRCAEDIRSADADLFKAFFHALVERGVSIAPSPFEVAFVSAAHEDEHLDATVTAIAAALNEARK